jgi:proteasome lid subunit RPN8/RPN11
MDPLVSGQSEGLVLSPAQRGEILTWLEMCLPEEACGLLVGCGKMVERVILVINSLHSPVRFSMDPAGMLKAFLEMDASGQDLVGIFHSHPIGEAKPSETDIAETFYPEAVSLICARQANGWSLRAFRIREGQFNEVPLEFSEPG